MSTGLPRRAYCVLPLLAALAAVSASARGSSTMQNVAQSAPTLTAIRLSAGEVSPGFSPGRFEYSVRVRHAVDRLTVTAEAPQGVAIRVDGRPTAVGAPSEPIALGVGRGYVRVEVAAANGSAKAAYTLKVIRDHPTPTWVRVREACPFAPRDSAGEIVFDNRMWLLGGYTPSLQSDVWSSSDGEQWTQVGTIPSEAGVNIPVNLVFDGRMWVVTNDAKLYASADGRAWDLVTDKAPWGKRYGAGGAVFRGRMWILGGLRSGQVLNDVWSSTDGVDWTLEAEHAPWSPRQLFGMVAVHRGRMWIVGGGITVYHPYKAYNDVWSTVDGRTWTRISDDAPWPVRTWSTVAVYRNRLWLLGGFRSEPTWNNFADAWYSTDGAAWRRLLPQECWSARHELSAYVFRERLWVVAGNAWPLMNDVWSLSVPGLTFLTQPVIEHFATTEYVYRASADLNASAEPVRYRIVEGPSWLRVSAATGVVRGTPPGPGDYAVTLEARDPAGESARQSFTVHVVPIP